MATIWTIERGTDHEGVDGSTLFASRDLAERVFEWQVIEFMREYSQFSGASDFTCEDEYAHAGCWWISLSKKEVIE